MLGVKQSWGRGKQEERHSRSGGFLHECHVFEKGWAVRWIEL